MGVKKLKDYYLLNLKNNLRILM